jgi:hypothetical protein
MAVDQPVTQEASRGPKSRAGLIAYPDRAPRLMPIATTARPMMNGAMFESGAVLRASVIASTSITKAAVPMISLRNPPSTDKPGPGEVEKTPWVAKLLSGSTWLNHS